VHDDPAPTEREQDETPDRIPEEEAMAGQGHEDPRAAEDPADA
jgi:hypothetical protein